MERKVWRLLFIDWPVKSCGDWWLYHITAMCPVSLTEQKIFGDFSWFGQVKFPSNLWFDILHGTSRQRVSWDFICARWTLCLKSRLLLDHRWQGRSRQTHEGELSGTYLLICMVKLGWWGGHSTCLYWWSQCLSELFLDAPFPWHWQFTLRRQK